ncbi:dUTPase [Weissella bombi]|uniref:dUTPase n=1 Tax=Weissella bombi TaxID=1505725 RepID=UPI003AF2B5FB
MPELDIAQYLRQARDLSHVISNQWEMPIGPKQVLLNDYLNLDVTLSKLIMATQAVMINVPSESVTRDENEISDFYAQALVQFLTISLKQQWTHLMVMTDEDIAQFKRFPQRHLAHQYMGIKTMLLNSYHQKRQGDFSHAWRSFLKLGLVELQLTQNTIDKTVRKILMTSTLDSL